ncbi:CHASE2 domain-containing protein [Variovorax brevis]|uniref:CHASE2 domain-containing protein n=1 Tax=Variovorax brevis TaxID=3053503 RepID=UPI0033657F00
MAGHRVALGYYLTQGSTPLARGVLPPPVLPPAAFPKGAFYATQWNGFGGNIPALAKAATTAGFINAAIGPRSDGLLRAAPLIAYYDGSGGPAGYYESLGLAVYRLATGKSGIAPVFASAMGDSVNGPPPVEALLLGHGDNVLRVPVNQRASLIVPYRGAGGTLGGSFQYLSAMDVLSKGLAPGDLKDKIVLVGTTAPGLQDLRATPAGATFPGVEVHANVVSALLDQRLLTLPDYSIGYEVTVLLLAGVILAVGLSLLSVTRAVALFVATLAAVIGLNTWLFLAHGLVLPLASALVSMTVAFGVNMGWGYLVEARARRGLANLFGTYVPPQLVEKMLERPGRYSMRAESKELTAMFCDMRGFTELSEHLAPVVLQEFLNTVFSRLTEVISRHGGTVDKYMGDCVMAFWGVPVDTPNHASLAVQAALEMARSMAEMSEQNRAAGLPEVSVGIGINTGVMSVGDMGSAVRRSYTVIGDAVNLASRLEGLGGIYGVSIVASATTRDASPTFAWRELDRVRVKGRKQVVTISTPLTFVAAQSAKDSAELAQWEKMLAAYQAQRPDDAQELLDVLMARDAKKVLYRLYTERIASMKLRPFDPEWDGATRFESK